MRLGRIETGGLPRAPHLAAVWATTMPDRCDRVAGSTSNQITAEIQVDVQVDGATAAGGRGRGRGRGGRWLEFLCVCFFLVV